MNVTFTPNALGQLDDVLSYIEERSPQGAQRVKGRIRATIDLLAAHPSIGRATDRPGQRRLMISPYPYAIFYRVRAGEVIIQRVRHTSRRQE